MFANGLIDFNNKRITMGKRLIIKGADFSNVSVGTSKESYNEVGIIDFKNYINIHLAIDSSKASTPWKVYNDLEGVDSYTIRVLKGEKYRLKFCAGAYSCVALGLKGTEVVQNNGFAQNHVAEYFSTESRGDLGEIDFTIGDNVDAIFICGRNSENVGFISGYELRLERLE